MRETISSGMGRLAPAFSDLAATAEHDHAIGDFEDVDEIVGDQHDCATPLRQLSGE